MTLEEYVKTRELPVITGSKKVLVGATIGHKTLGT